MLRLRPSEITLTPADVEETRRRMSRRHVAAPPVTLSSLSASPHRGPRLRRGPVRSRDDAVQHLGKIPVLTPHQVLHVSSDSYPEDGPSHQRDSSVENSEVDDSINRLLSSDTQTEQSQASSPSPVRSQQHPFPTALGRGDLSTNRLASPGNTDVGGPSSPSKRTTGVLNFGRTRTNTSEDLSEGATNSRLHNSIDGSTEGDHATAAASSIPQPLPKLQPCHLVTPRRQAEVVSRFRMPPLRGERGEEASKSESLPTLFLQGHFASPQRYDFREVSKMPHTEPRKRSGRLVRTLSSSSDPSQMVTNSITRSLGSRHPGDSFLTPSAAEPLTNLEHATGDATEPSEGSKARASFEDRIRRVHTRLESIQGRTRGFFGKTREEQTEEMPCEPATNTSSSAPEGPERASERVSERVSEASSSSSLPYSYYELPLSRRSSREQSQSGEHLQQSQVDGAAPSRDVSRGAYFSIRPSQVRAADEPVARPTLARVSSFSEPNLTGPLGQQHLSPRPASPYTRADSGPGVARPSMILLTAEDLVGNGQDAASAAVRDLSSPLDLVAQRAYVQLAQTSALLSTTAPGPSPAPRVTSTFQYQVQDFDADPRRIRHPEPGSMRRESGNSAHYRMTHMGRQLDDMRLSDPIPHHHERSSTHTSEPQTYRRGAHATRTGQRSSENVPVGALSAYPVRPVSRASHDHPGHRVSFAVNNHRPRTAGGVAMRGGGDLPAFPPPVRFSVPPPHLTHPRNISMPVRGQTRPFPQPPGTRPSRSTELGSDTFTSSSSPIPPYATYQGHRHISQRHAPGTGPGPARVRRAMTSSGTHSNSSDTESVPRRYPTPRPFDHSQPPPPPRLYPGPQLRAPPHMHVRLTPAADTSGGRRPPIPARITSRRVSAQQRDQENSGDAEAEMMREELAAVRFRYDEGAVLDVLDETPPRVGRFERRMMQD